MLYKQARLIKISITYFLSYEESGAKENKP